MTSIQSVGSAAAYRLDADTAVTRIGYGAMRLAGVGVWAHPDDPDNAVAVLREAVALGVNFFDCLRFADEQMFGAAFKLRTAVVINGQVLRMQVRAHRPIKDDDSIFECFEKVGHLNCRLPIADYVRIMIRFQSPIRNRKLDRVGGGVTFRRPPTPPYVRFRIRRFTKPRERQSGSRNEYDHGRRNRLPICGSGILALP